MLKHFAWIIVIVALLAGCHTQNDEVPTPVKPIPEKPAEPVKETPRPTPVVPQEVPVPPPAPVKLDVHETTLESLSQPKDTSLHADAPTKQLKNGKADKKVKVSGGVLTDDKAENLKDSVSGGEVKVDIKLD
nr:hypothetical protein [uncultured Desulfuromonas sp.]